MSLPGKVVCQICGQRYYDADARDGSEKKIIGADRLTEHAKTCAPTLLKTRKELRRITGCGCCAGDPEGVLSHDAALRGLLMHALTEHYGADVRDCEQCAEARVIATATLDGSDKLTEEW